MTRVPELSAVLPTGHLKQAAWAIRALSMRAEEAPLELVLLYEYGDPEALDGRTLDRFARTRLVRTDTTRSAAFARAEGVRAAAAEVVVFAEPHCFPRRGWARALLAAHREGAWTVVGPQFECGNPGGGSEAILLGDYTDWIAPAQRREVEHLPGHNSAYRRDALLALGDDLAPLLEAESVLHWRLREHGARLLLEPAATVGHRNFRRPAQVWSERRAVGQMFAATRAREWGLGRRLAAAGAAVALPPVLIWRRVRRARDRHRGDALKNGISALIVAAWAQAVGEVAGYLRGIGDSPIRLATYEFSPRLGNPPGDPPDASMLEAAELHRPPPAISAEQRP